MKRKIWKWFVPFFIAAVILPMGSCGGGHNTDTDTGTIVLINNSVVTVDGFFLAPIDQISWGPNILSGPLFSGQRTFIVDIYPGYYDARIRATRTYSEYFSYLDDIPIDPGSFFELSVYDSSFTGSLEIRNTSQNASIIAVYVVPSNAPTWGVNQTSSVIQPSGLLHLTDFTTGLYAVKVVWNIRPDSIYNTVRIDSLTLRTINAI